jgi:cation:H+ antiporter
MSPALALPLFCVSLVVTLAAASVFASRLDHLGVRIGLPEAAVGLLTAIAADGPEISAALAALAKGANSVSVGVVVGSNVFNLAAMLGIGALLAGRVRLGRETLFFEGVVGLLLGLIVTGVLLKVTSPMAAAILLAVVLAPYLLLLVGGPQLAAPLAPVSKRVTTLLVRALGARERPRQPEDYEHTSATVAALLLLLAVALIVLGSLGMVQAAISLGDRWHVSQALVGVLVLAPLTSLPNVFTAVRLALADRGAAVVTETFNSNSINLVAGVAAPALVVGVIGGSPHLDFDLAWLLAMTLAAIWLLAGRRGLGRAGGAALIALYAIFVGVVAGS